MGIMYNVLYIEVYVFDVKCRKKEGDNNKVYIR